MANTGLLKMHTSIKCNICNKVKKTKDKRLANKPCHSCSAKNRPSRQAWNKGTKPSKETIEKCRKASIGRKHTEESKAKMSANRKGITPWNKGKKVGSYSKKHRIAISCAKRGISEEEFDDFAQKDNIKLRKTFNKMKLHTKCFEKYNYTCQKCNKRGGDLNAHHINPWSVNEEDRFNVDNLVCLCTSCHKEFHSHYGQTSTSNMHLEEYLSREI